MGHLSMLALISFAGICAFKPPAAHQIADTVGYDVANGLQKTREVLDRNVSDAPVSKPSWIGHGKTLFKRDGEAAAEVGGAGVMTQVNAIEIQQDFNKPLPPISLPMALQRGNNSPQLLKDYQRVSHDDNLRREMRSWVEACVIDKGLELWQSEYLEGTELQQATVTQCNIELSGFMGERMPVADVVQGIHFGFAALKAAFPDLPVVP